MAYAQAIAIATGIGAFANLMSAKSSASQARANNYMTKEMWERQFAFDSKLKTEYLALAKDAADAGRMDAEWTKDYSNWTGQWGQDVTEAAYGAKVASAKYASDWNTRALAENKRRYGKWEDINDKYTKAGTDALGRLENLTTGKTDPMQTTAHKLRQKRALEGIQNTRIGQGSYYSGGTQEAISDYLGAEAVDDLERQTKMESTLAYTGNPYKRSDDEKYMSGAADMDELEKWQAFLKKQNEKTNYEPGGGMAGGETPQEKTVKHDPNEGGGGDDKEKEEWYPSSISPYPTNFHWKSPWGPTPSSYQKNVDDTGEEDLTHKDIVGIANRRIKEGKTLDAWHFGYMKAMGQIRPDAKIDDLSSYT